MLIFRIFRKVKVLVAQSCLTLYDPMDCSPSGSSVHGILQALMLEWVAMSFSRGIFLTQGVNPGPLQCRQILYCLRSRPQRTRTMFHSCVHVFIRPAGGRRKRAHHPWWRDGLRDAVQGHRKLPCRQAVL